MGAQQDDDAAADELSVDVVDIAGDIVTITVRGDLDRYGSHRLDAAVETLDTARATDVRIDCSAVPFVDAHGLRSLVRAEERLGGSCRLHIINPTLIVQTTLQISGLSRLLGTRQRC